MTTSIQEDKNPAPYFRQVIRAARNAGFDSIQLSLAYDHLQVELRTQIVVPRAPPQLTAACVVYDPSPPVRIDTRSSYPSYHEVSRPLESNT
jgi:hypothetical protein